MSSHNPEPQLLEIRKYQNRRYYDTTNSRHLCLQDIHKLIVEGHNVRIVDAQSGQDITPKILTQILLDYEPLKLEVFSNELLTQAIRVNDSLLKDFVDLYFRQAFEAFCGSQRHFKTMLREAHQLTSTLARPATWIGGLFPSSTHAPATPEAKPAEESQSNAAPDSLKQDIEQLRREMSEMKARLGKSHPEARKVKPSRTGSKATG
jgi:polyhydroxyalkanoate synthesis repressor PhaR